MSNAQTAFDYFVSQGLPPHQAAGIVGNLQGESGQGLDTGARAPGDGRDGSDSIGIGQWNSTRAQALKNYAESKGVPWTDLNLQLEFLHSELKGPENSAFRRIQAATTPEEASQAMLAFERPKDWNKPGAYPDRARNAVAAHSAFAGGQPVPGAPRPPMVASEPPIFAPNQQPIPGAGGNAPAAATSSYAGPSLIDPGQLQPPQAPPIFFPRRQPPNLSKLRAAFKPPTFAQG